MKIPVVTATESKLTHIVKTHLIQEKNLVMKTLMLKLLCQSLYYTVNSQTVTCMHNLMCVVFHMLDCFKGHTCTAIPEKVSPHNTYPFIASSSTWEHICEKTSSDQKMSSHQGVP